MSREQWGHGYYAGVQDGLKAKVSFYDFCVTMHDGEDSIVGDFVFDMQRDSAFPRKIPSYNDWRTGKPYKSLKNVIKDHLHSGTINSCAEADLAFNELWSEWKSYQGGSNGNPG